jgi:arylsulfatase A-like enzyme
MQNLESRIPGSYSKFIKSYAACCAFADAQVGKLLDAVERSLPKENTVIVLWSDHGFHLGEKDHIEKFMLWEKSTHVPFIFVVPGITKERSICKVPVDLTALYPTLLEVCGLPKDKSCDGMSVLPLLKGNKANWKRPALMTYKKGNHALRADRWRYIRYADGTEELYDHEKDPNEWDNLAQEPKCSAIIDSYRKWLPVNEMNQVPDLKRKK